MRYEDQRVHRYRVTATWGEVPPNIAQIVNKRGAYCIDTYRGKETQWEIERRGEIIGGWAGRYMGVSPPAITKIDDTATSGAQPTPTDGDNGPEAAR